jgi:hypothetical protein
MEAPERNEALAVHRDMAEHAMRFEDQVRRISEQLAASEGEWIITHDLIVRLERLIFEADALAPDVSRVVFGRFLPSELCALNEHYCRWETELEWRFVRTLLNGESRYHSYLLYQRFEELIRREIALLGAKRPGCVVFIGSGPFPVSALHICRALGARVVCVDRDGAAVSISREIMRRLDFANRIEIVHASGSDFDFSSVDAIWIALLAKPKGQILASIRASCPARVLCRTSAGLRRLVYEATADGSTAGFHVADTQIATGDQTISTLLLERA